MIDFFKALFQRTDRAPVLEAALARWVEREFDENWNACLDAIGTPPEQRAPLAKVFVDLSDQAPRNDAPLDAYPNDAPSPGVLAKLLGRAPQARPPEREVPGLPAFEPKPDDGGPHLVVVGGPGQGKTTLVQFLAQVHRASLLEARRGALTAPQRHALDLMKARLTRDRLPEPARPCLPLHVTLRYFASERPAAGDGSASLFEHLRARIAAAAQTAVDAVALDAALREGPWLLVLDGLDEVPASAGRARVLAAAAAFLTRYGDAPHLVVATTRPQGYGGELDDYETLTLAPLSRARALWYARDLVTQWYPDEAGARGRLLDRLLQAARDGATARLMETPLQVTILAALLIRIPRAPQERWRLFKDYYTTLYNRELDRHTEAAETLLRYRPHVDAIHQQVALHLQVSCERDGGADALLTAEEVTRIAEGRLAREGFDAAQRAEIARRIVEAAATRLVLLVSPREGRFGFELRPLQEFMAAEALMSGREQAVLDRMQRIARVPSWRSVLLLAISRCFATASELTTALTEDLCAALDEDPSDPVAVAIGAGVTLAREILEEGSALYYPATSGRLLRRVLDAVPAEYERGRDPLTSLLSALHQDLETARDAERLVMQAIEKQVLDPAGHWRPAWRALVRACMLGIEGAEELAERAWKMPHTEHWGLLAKVYDRRSAWLARTLRAEPRASSTALQRPMEVEIGGFARADAAMKLLRENLLTMKRADAIGSAVGLIATQEEAHFPRRIAFVVDVCKADLLPEVAEETFLTLLQHPRAGRGARQAAVSGLSTMFSRRRSGLDSPDVWRALQLPDPPPPHAPAAPSPAGVDEGPVRVESIVLEGVRGFARFELLPAPPDNGHGQWVVLIGENGVGKTTVLRALALALVPPALATVALTRLPAPLRREGAARCEALVRLRGLHARVRVDQSGAQEVVVPEGDVPDRYPFVVAYGCRRGTAVGGPERALLHEPFHDIHTLFDDTQAGINHAESWLKHLHHRALEEPHGAAPRVLSEVLQVLAALLPGVDAIEVQSREVWFEGPAIGRVRLGGLSDGYVTTAGWVCDLMARWLHRMERSEQEVPVDFPSRMTGLVLLDEIDLNLHPRWQLGVIESVRRRFGRLSFVVTTHNPLTLLGAHAGELQVLHGQGGAVTARQIDVPKGLRADQVLTGAWFGVMSTVDPETLELLARHRERIRGGAKPGDPSVAALEAEIRRRLGTFDPDTLDRVSTWKDEGPGAVEPARREAVAADVRAQLRARRAKG